MWGEDKGKDMSCWTFWVPRTILREVSPYVLRSEGGKGRGDTFKGSAMTLYWLITPKEMPGLLS